GLRVAKSLELPTAKNPGVTGQYRSSEGKTGADVWAKRARWVMLTGKVDAEPVTIAIFDHPKNPGFPTRWHARGYGLFAVNPLGAKALDKDAEAMNFTIDKKQSARFAYRILILSRDATPEDVEAEYQRFIKEVK